jgi:GNAT superfamily N-acetyltransferase
MLFDIIEPHSQQEWDAYYELRFLILRKPWQQIKGSEKSNNEDACLHALAVDKITHHYLACGRAEWIDTKSIQIRYMAVAETTRSRGLGKAILMFLETKMKQQGATTSLLHARENALPFYIKQGYLLKEKSHLLFGEIQHFLMEKPL